MHIKEVKMPSPRAAFRSTRPLSSRGVTRTRHSDRSIDPRRHFGQHLVIEALDDKSPDFETHAHVPNAPWTDNDVRPVFLQKAQRPEFVSHPQDNRRIIAVWIPEPPVPSQVAAPYAPGHRQVRLMTERYSRTTPRPAPPRQRRYQSGARARFQVPRKPPPSKGSDDIPRQN